MGNRKQVLVDSTLSLVMDALLQDSTGARTKLQSTWAAGSRARLLDQIQRCMHERGNRCITWVHGSHGSGKSSALSQLLPPVSYPPDEASVPARALVAIEVSCSGAGTAAAIASASTSCGAGKMSVAPVASSAVVSSSDRSRSRNAPLGLQRLNQVSSF
jgi:hypothetical protein